MEKLCVINLSKSLSKNAVLQNINFTIEEGEFLTILGPSGCGKTTLLRILIGLDFPDTGQIFKDGTEITNEVPSNRGMGIVFQNYALFENMTVLENIEYALRRNKTLRNSSRSIAMEMVALVKLDEHINKKPSALSGGQQQRVAIARTLALGPDIILFDEPMAALDADTRMMLRTEIKRIQKELGATIIYITHDQEEAFAMSDRIMVMNDGKIIQLDTPENIVTHPANEYIQQFVIKNLEMKIDSLIKYVNTTPHN
ncbi:MAG: ABC transporter ATP-binding protein [Lachnospiraceae bacterium]|nr:ABC transporter ATP-binding protein [Lachnospiraceae bacterium]